eukprot:3966005-Pleurochrysis_carterae.AAC.1
MVAIVSSMCSRWASYEGKRRRAGGSREGTRGPKASSSGELSSLAFAVSPARLSVSLSQLRRCSRCASPSAPCRLRPSL